MKTEINELSGKGFYINFIKIDDNKFDLLDFFDLDPKKYPFLLESVAKGNERARFSILFNKPDIILKKISEDSTSFLDTLDKEIEKNKITQEDIFIGKKKIELPFLGGWFVYLGYELVMEIETSLTLPSSPFQIPTAFAARVSSAIVYDNLENTLYFITEGSKDTAKDMLLDFEKINKKFPKKFLKRRIEVTKKGTDKQHQDDIRKCIEFIFQGEIFQANLSRLWEFKIEKHLLDSDIYRELRKTNPSPFSGLLMLEEGSIISSSPERLVSVKKNIIETRPIAGTRPRGKTGITDVELSRELISSVKERAEHLMLVDLERNDIARVCEAGSVKVDEMMVVESYSHVHHIVSNIKGKLKEGIKPGKIISAVFPGGTITGCPKVKCIEILGDLEKIGRGPYTGSFGYINHNGNLDLNILIRTLVREENKLSLRAGGGIVADSVPEKETLETEAKANAMLKALQNLRFK